MREKKFLSSVWKDVILYYAGTFADWEEASSDEFEKCDDWAVYETKYVKMSGMDLISIQSNPKTLETVCENLGSCMRASLDDRVNTVLFEKGVSKESVDVVYYPEIETKEDNGLYDFTFHIKYKVVRK